MPLAMQEWPRMQADARALGLVTRVHRDPKTTDSEWRASIAAIGWPQESPATHDPEMTCEPKALPPEHFPTAWVVTAQGTHPWPIQGVMPSQPWRDTLQHRVQFASRTTPLPTPPAMASPSEKYPLNNSNPSCIAAVQYLPLDGPNPQAELGGYERISPDGRFILRSFSGSKVGQVSLIELPSPHAAQTLKHHPTPLRNEAFPTQGSWRFLVDVDGTHHRFRDVLRLGAQAKPLFKAGMTGFYAAASELPRSESNGNGVIHIRSLSWPQASANDPSGGGDDAAIGPLQARTIAIQDDWPKTNSARVVADTGAQFICTQRAAVDGAVYALPMISVDGLEFSAVPQNPQVGAPSMRSYQLANAPMSASHPCQMTHDLSSAPSKAVFGFARANQVSVIAYTDNSQVKLLDRGLNQSFALVHSQHEVLASAFAGVTVDGRVIFAATWKNCPSANCPTQAGYVIADPNQLVERIGAHQARGIPAPACITDAAVAEARAEFAKFHRLDELGGMLPTSPRMGQSQP